MLLFKSVLDVHVYIMSSGGRRSSCHYSSTASGVHVSCWRHQAWHPTFSHYTNAPPPHIILTPDHPITLYSHHIQSHDTDTSRSHTIVIVDRLITLCWHQPSYRYHTMSHYTGSWSPNHMMLTQHPLTLYTRPTHVIQISYPVTLDWHPM